MRLQIPYFSVAHGSDECIQIIKDRSVDVGVILGARILPQRLISVFPKGILNMHPGLIPENRGLDNLKWAVINDLPQGVTAHLISSKIDFGPVIVRREVPVFRDDTLVDVHLRLQNAELYAMDEALEKIQIDRERFETPSVEGNYFHSVPPELERGLMAKFETYKERFGLA